MNRVNFGLHTSGVGPRLHLLHGFTQTHRSWDAVTHKFASDFTVTSVDLPGHGTSADIQVDLPTGALLLAAALGRGTYIGYSMGARLALHIALEQPLVVDRLVLLGGTAGLPSDDERAERRASDEALAKCIERDGVDAFLDRWLAQPMFADVPDDRADRLRNSAAGLAASLRLTGTGSQDSLWDRLPELSMPTLILAGERDTKFCTIGRDMAAVIGPQARFATIPDAGHAAHLEQPAPFVELLRAWLIPDPNVRHDTSSDNADTTELGNGP